VTAATTRENTASGKVRGGYVTHTVRRGESLWSISEKYNVTVQELFRWNGLRKGGRIMPGKKLKIKARKSDDSDDA
jgi:LysM repeat protein